MYETKPFPNPIRLIHHEQGVTHVFDDITDLVRNWPWVSRLDFSPTASYKKVWCNRDDWEHHYFLAANRGQPLSHRHEYMLCDSLGDAIDRKWVATLYQKTHQYRGHCYPNPCHPGAKRRNYSYYRHPQTTQERRWADAWDDEEFAPKCRATRNARTLPNCWDDFVRSNHRNRTWKHYRKHQWKD